MIAPGTTLPGSGHITRGAPSHCLISPCDPPACFLSRCSTSTYQYISPMPLLGFWCDFLSAIRLEGDPTHHIHHTPTSLSQLAISVSTADREEASGHWRELKPHVVKYEIRSACNLLFYPTRVWTAIILDFPRVLGAFPPYLTSESYDCSSTRVSSENQLLNTGDR